MTRDNTSSNSKMQALPTLGIRIEHHCEAFGIGTDRPRLSWIVDTETQGWLQSACEIEVYDADGNLRGQTGRVDSHQSVLIARPARSHDVIANGHAVELRLIDSQRGHV